MFSIQRAIAKINCTGLPWGKFVLIIIENVNFSKKRSTNRAFVASKHEVVGLTKTVALEYAKAGIRVNAVCPGVILTPMVERITGNHPGAIKAMAVAQPIGRAGKPEEIATAVV